MAVEQAGDAAKMCRCLTDILLGYRQQPTGVLSQVPVRLGHRAAVFHKNRTCVAAHRVDEGIAMSRDPSQSCSVPHSALGEPNGLFRPF